MKLNIIVILSLNAQRAYEILGTGLGLAAPNIRAKNLSLMTVVMMLTPLTIKNLGAATGMSYSLHINSVAFAVVYVFP